mgnify:CR=1 FL=1
MLPLPGREERRLLLVAEFKEYVMCCSHFSLTKEDQVLSVPIILDALKDIRKPLFLAGDMNSIQGSPTQNALQEKFMPLNNYKDNTIPGQSPNRCIDLFMDLIMEINILSYVVRCFMTNRSPRIICLFS